MINANIRTKNFLIHLVYFIPVTELVTCYMYKSPLSVSVSNRLNISHMGLYGSVMQVFFGDIAETKIRGWNESLWTFGQLNSLFRTEIGGDIDTGKGL